ncbi:MAG: RES family NAD+ phosphorylase [Candidatus Acidiferrum sp.]
MKRRSFSGPWYRGVGFDHLLKPPPGAPAGSPVRPLWPGAAHRKGARFTPKAPPASPIDCLYLASEDATPVLEVSRVYRPAGSPVRLLFDPLVVMAVKGVLTNILDISQNGNQLALGTTVSELTGTWELPQQKYLSGAGPMPPTQLLAQAAYHEGNILGLAYLSAKSATSDLSFVVFTDRLAKCSSFLELHNSDTGTLQQRLG